VVAVDLDHGFTDGQEVVAVDVGHFQAQERERLPGARGRPQPAADQDVVADQLPPSTTAR